MRGFFRKKPSPGAMGQDTYKARSEAWLRERGIPYCNWLAADEEPLVLRGARDVGERAVVLSKISARACPGVELSADEVREWLSDRGVEHALSPSEEAFLNDPRPSAQTKLDLSWRCEAAWTLAWTIGWVERLLPRDQMVDLKPLVDDVFSGDVRSFLDNATLRPEPEIHAEHDLTLRIYWAVIEAQIGRIPPLAGIEPGIMAERLIALNYVVQPDTPWDDIRPDT